MADEFDNPAPGGIQVRSFDVFDTLIARRCIKPKTMLAPIEEQGYVGFFEKRSAAGHRVHETQTVYTIDDIYLDLVTQGVYSQTDARALLKLELKLELENCIPIQANLDRVRDGDILVSDMYYTPEFIRTLLTHAGLRRDYRLFVSPAGKLTGTIWPEILESYSISCHYGDNPDSDMVSPANYGIRSRLSTLHRPTAIEALLMSYGQNSLAWCIREVRLAAAIDDEVLEYLHDCSCQINFPLLVLFSRLVHSELKALEMTRVAFVTRDCFNLKRVFRSMFRNVVSTDFFSSRKCLRGASPSYLEYLEPLCQDTLLVELDTSGTSLAQALRRLSELGKIVTPTVFTAIFLDMKLKRYREYVQHPRPPLPAMHHFTTTQRVGTEVGVLWEMLNFAPYPSVMDVIRLPESGAYHPVFQNRSLVEEYLDPGLVDAMNESIRTCIALAPWEDIAAESETANIPVLLDSLIEELSACKQLLDIFPRLMIDAVPEERGFFESLGRAPRRKLLGFVRKIVKNRRRLFGYVLTRLRPRSHLASKTRGRF